MQREKVVMVEIKANMSQDPIDVSLRSATKDVLNTLMTLSMVISSE